MLSSTSSSGTGPTAWPSSRSRGAAAEVRAGAVAAGADFGAATASPAVAAAARPNKPVRAWRRVGVGVAAGTVFEVFILRSFRRGRRFVAADAERPRGRSCRLWRVRRSWRVEGGASRGLMGCGRSHSAPGPRPPGVTLSRSAVAAAVACPWFSPSGRRACAPGSRAMDP